MHHTRPPIFATGSNKGIFIPRSLRRAQHDCPKTKAIIDELEKEGVKEFGKFILKDGLLCVPDKNNDEEVRYVIPRAEVRDFVRIRHALMHSGAHKLWQEFGIWTLEHR